MKASTVLIWLFIIGTIFVSEIKSNDKLQCKDLNDNCESNTDCCSQKCGQSYMQFNSKNNCKESDMVFDIINHVPLSKNFRLLCLFNETDMNDNSISEMLYKKFKMNASNNKLLPMTVIEVTYGNITVFVQINDHLPETSDSDTLYLCKEAADKLGIEPGKAVPCDIQVSEINRRVPLAEWLMIGGIFISVIAVTSFSQH